MPFDIRHFYNTPKNVDIFLLCFKMTEPNYFHIQDNPIIEILHTASIRQMGPFGKGEICF